MQCREPTTLRESVVHSISLDHSRASQVLPNGDADVRPWPDRDGVEDSGQSRTHFRACTALHCTELHCAALHCAALRCTALRCTALRCTAAGADGCAHDSARRLERRLPLAGDDRRRQPARRAQRREVRLKEYLEGRHLQRRNVRPVMIDADDDG